MRDRRPDYCIICSVGKVHDAPSSKRYCRNLLSAQSWPTPLAQSISFYIIQWHSSSTSRSFYWVMSPCLLRLVEDSPCTSTRTRGATFSRGIFFNQVFACKVCFPALLQNHLGKPFMGPISNCLPNLLFIQALQKHTFGRFEGVKMCQIWNCKQPGNRFYRTDMDRKLLNLWDHVTCRVCFWIRQC